MRIKLLLTVATILLCIPVVFSQAAAQPTPNVGRSPYDCTDAPPSTNPRTRRAMKIRGPEVGATYIKYNDGKAISVAEWFKYTCGLNKFVAAEPPADKPIEGAENVTVKLTGYVLAVKFMRAGDGDMHVELGDGPNWDEDHVVIEMSPGKDFCKGRQTLWKLVEKDGCDKDECILKHPIKVEVTGYMLSGGAPQGTTDYCNYLSPRGLKDASHPSKVKGVWRLQPILTLKKK